MGTGDLSLQVYFVVGFHTLSLLLAFLAAHDRATKDNYTQHTGKERPSNTI